MGLCKCPQRKVSTLFCFQHHVNVCESCLVSDHSQCIVRSYVSWLQDNDYNPNCPLCQRPLSETNEETIRLVCYDVFHWPCLDKHFRSFPSNTAPDGYTCPTCHACIFPATNLVSPVADQVREKLAKASWSNRLTVSNLDTQSNFNEKLPSLTQTEKNGYVIVNSSIEESNNGSKLGISYHPNRANDTTQAATTVMLQSSTFDPDDEDKYKRRSVFTWFARWLRSRQSSSRKGALSSNQGELSRTRFTVYMIFLVIFIFISILTVLYHLTRGDSDQQQNSDDDPQFNPLNNPFIRVGGQFLKNRFKNPKSPDN